ncbi:MAG: DUF6365 family protein [Actinocrinis sp.]
MTVRLLFMAMSSAGFGETLIGMSLARQLRRAGVQSHFVIDGTSETLLRGSEFTYTVLDASMGPLARLLVDEVVDGFRPDAIVLSDYFTFHGVFSKRFRLDAWFVESYGLPILPIDIWEWDRSPFKVDVFVGKHLDVSRHILELPVYLRPVPVAHLDDGGDPKVLPFRLWEGDEKVTRRTRNHLRTTFGAPPGARLVLLAVAGWQQGKYDDDNGDRIAAKVPELLAHYLAQLPEQAHFVIVGTVPPALRGLPADRVHTIPSCSPSRFNVLLGSVDLVLTLNVGATTLARAVLSDIPGMCLTNSHGADGDEGIAKLEGEFGGLSPFVRDWLGETTPMYPFRMWPLGFHTFLDPLVTDNPYMSTIVHAELLDEAAVLSGLNRVLFDAGTRDALAAARAGYLAQLARHRDTAQVFADAAALCGLDMG